MQALTIFLRKTWSATTDLIPIVLVVVFFQTVVIQQPFPQIGEILIGSVFVVLGLMLFH